MNIETVGSYKTVASRKGLCATSNKYCISKSEVKE